MTRAASGAWAFPTNSVNPAVAATAINPTHFNALLADMLLGLNEGIYGVLTADYTLTDQNTAQKAFNNSTGGIFAVAASTTYLVEAEYAITNTGTNAHTWAVLFALTTATFTSAFLRVRGRSGATSLATFAADLSGSTTDPTSALVCTASSTSSTENVLLSLRGVFRVNVAGTITPQVKLSATTGGTIKMLANSFISLRPIGGNAVTSIGTWT